MILEKNTASTEFPSGAFGGMLAFLGGTENSFEKNLSLLTVAIGNMERLSDLEPDQIDRLRQAVIRLSNCERKHGRD